MKTKNLLQRIATGTLIPITLAIGLGCSEKKVKEVIDEFYNFDPACMDLNFNESYYRCNRENIYKIK